MAFVLLDNSSSSLCKKKHGSYVHTYNANDAEHTYRQEVLCIAVESSQHESVYTTSSRQQYTGVCVIIAVALFILLVVFVSVVIEHNLNTTQCCQHTNNCYYDCSYNPRLC
jgi:hypothetical protein